MYCPSCHTICSDSDFFCHACGTSLRHANAPRKGSLLIPAIILILISVFGLLLFFISPRSDPSASSADAACFQLYDGTLYFNGSHYTGSSELTVPSEIGGKAVRSLSESCFAGSTGLTTVILPDTLTSIGDRAFDRCSSIRGIYIPASVRSIGIEAFSGCTQLEAIYLNKELKVIHAGAFDRCSSLNYIFFEGTFKQWQKLYDEDINDHVVIICKDGSFYQDGIAQE